MGHKHCLAVSGNMALLRGLHRHGGGRFGVDATPISPTGADRGGGSVSA